MPAPDGPQPPLPADFAAGLRAPARRVARLLGNAVLLTHDGYGHTTPVDPSACVGALSRETEQNLPGVRASTRGREQPD